MESYRIYNAIAARLNQKLTIIVNKLNSQTRLSLGICTMVNIKNSMVSFLIVFHSLSCFGQETEFLLSVEPLTIGETLTIKSELISENRQVNVYFPKVYFDDASGKYPVLYMPDGGVNEDFLHIAGLIQIGSLNWSMKPHILVGIENTDRARDLTGITSSDKDREISARIAGSEPFRNFIRTELMPIIDSRYRTSGETAIVGESLAGLFVVDTLLEEPELFDSYIAIDPSLWWDNHRLVKTAVEIINEMSNPLPRLHLAVSQQEGIVEPARELVEILKKRTNIGVSFIEYPNETHLTVYHPAALDAFRMILPRAVN